MFKIVKSRIKASKLWLVYSFFRESVSFWILLVKHNSSINTEKNLKKMQYSLLRENHTIEKGMSMKDPRKGFGQEKVLKLLEGLRFYYLRYKDKGFLIYPIATIMNYIRLTKNNKVEIPLIEESFYEICKLAEIDINNINLDAGVKEVTKESVWKKSRIDFEGFMNVRYSIRYFSSEIPDINIINKALTIAQRTPSACNRQAWYSYVFQYEKTQELLAWQNGAKGFEKDIPMSILVTADMNAFLSWEPHQTYVDGGMYAMSLIYSLHSQGLGTIPLSTGVDEKRINQLHKLFNIPENEVPIVIIGVGNLLDKFNVAVSTRKSIDSTTIYL